MKRASEPFDSKLHSTSTRGDEWTFMRVRLKRQERDVFGEIVQRTGHSPNKLLRSWVRRIIEAGALHLCGADARDGVPETSAADELFVHGIPASRLSQIGSTGASTAHEDHVDAGMPPPAEDAASEEGSTTLEEYIESYPELVELALLRRLMEFIACDMLVPTRSFLARAGWTGQALRRAEQAGRIFHIDVGGIRAYPSFTSTRAMTGERSEQYARC